MTQVNRVIVKADQMREVASRNPTARALLLYLALYDKSVELKLGELQSELNNRGIAVNEQHLYDTLQELEDFGLGSIIYAKRGQGDDIFKRNYNLKSYARRAFPILYMADWDQRADELGDKLKLVDPKFKFQQTPEEKREEKRATGKRGRPEGWSMKLGRFLTSDEIKAREEAKKNKRPRGRPVGWRKDPGKAIKLASQGKGKRGRPKGWSMKLGRFLTPSEMAAKERSKQDKGVRGRGRPVGWRKNPEATSKNPIKVTKGIRVLSIPLKNDRLIRIELPKKLGSDETALLKLTLEQML